MTTAADIYTDALQKLGVYAAGEPVSAVDAAQCLRTLGDMVDLWRSESLTLFQVTQITINLVAQQWVYSIGTGQGGADIVALRPSRVTYGPGAASVTVGTTMSPVNVVSEGEWLAGPNIVMVTSDDPSQSGTPDTLFYDPQYPLGIINISPKPDVDGTVQFGGWYPLAPPDGTTNYNLAPGVADALKNNLAVALKTYFSEKEVPPSVIAAAVAGKQSLRYQGLVSRAILGRGVASATPRNA